MLEGIGHLSLLAVTVSVSTLALVASASYQAGMRTARRSMLGAADSRPANTPYDRSAPTVADRFVPGTTPAAADAAAAVAQPVPAGPARAAATPAPAPRSVEPLRDRVSAAPANSAPRSVEPLRDRESAAPAKQRWALKPVHHVSDDQAVGMFAQFLREIGGGVHALCAADVHVNFPGGLVPLLDDPSLAADWLLLDELHEFYRGWCRLEGVLPMTRAVLQEKIEGAGAVKKRHWAAGGSCERLRSRVRPDRLPQRPVLVRVLSLQEMARRERSRHAGAGRATSDRDVMWTRAA